MTQKEIDTLLDKFEAGNCSAEEELLVDGILEAQAEGMDTVYEAFLNEERLSASSSHVQLIVQAEDGELDEILDVQASDMGSIYKDFVASAKNEHAEFDVDLLLQAHDGRLDKMLEQQEMGEAYDKFVAAEKGLVSKTDVELVIQAHTGGLDELLEHVKEVLPVEVDEEEAKVIPLSSRWKKYRGIAAIFVVALAAIFLLQTSNGWGDNQFADGLSVEERKEAELALEQTLAALGMTKNKLDKGTENMKLLKSLKHTEIFK